MKRDREKSEKKVRGGCERVRRVRMGGFGGGVAGGVMEVVVRCYSSIPD